MHINNYAIISWEKFKKILLKQFDINFNNIDSILEHDAIYTNEIKWHELKDWENIDDIDILTYFEKLKSFRGMLYVVTEASYNKAFGPFELETSDLHTFALNHLDAFGESFFNGDVIILSIDIKSVWIFHHEGVYSVINLGK
jgi:hypothetical protein